MNRWLLRAALRAYPPAFRRRFGSEMMADLERRTAGAEPAAPGLTAFVLAGLAERWSALVRVVAWPTHAAHLYEPRGRHHMLIDSIRLDLQHAFRLAARSRLVTALTILALALGIGATTAIFAIVQGVLLKPLPYADSERLVVVWSDAVPLGRARNTLSPANYRDFVRMNGTLERLEAYFSFVTPREMVVDGGASEVVIGVTVTPGLFDLLGRSPTLGRPFRPTSQDFDVVISHGFWQRRFGGDPAIVGRTIQLSDAPATIVGVMPADFTFPYGTMLGPAGFTRVTTVDLWMPMSFDGPLAAANRMLTSDGELVRGVHWLGAIGRMKPGVSVEQVQADLSLAAAQLAATYPETNKGWGATVVPVLEQTVGELRAPLLLLLGGVVAVLLIATMNVANLVLARSIARRKELATRVALGAGRRRLVQQALTEGLLLAGTGGLAGVLLSRWGVAALVAIAPADLPRLGEVSVDRTVLLVAAAVTMMTGIFLGLLPALSASGTVTHTALQDQSRGTIGARSSHRARAALVVTEVALAVTLVIAAGLLMRSFVSLMSLDPGFRPEQLLTWQTNIPDRLREPEQRDAFYQEFLGRMRALPGVASVGGTSRLPLGSTGLTTVLEVEGRATPPAEQPEVQFRRSVGDYFQTMGIPVLRGRTFTEADHRRALPVAVINDVLARRVFPASDPLGQRVRTAASQPWITIVGVVGAVKHGTLDEELAPEIYVPHTQGSLASPYMVLRTTGRAEDLADLVRAEARAIDADLPVYRMDTMEAVRAESMAQRRFVLVLSALFGLLALSLAAIGVYGVMSLLVSERTQEVGVRLALGAQPAQMLVMLVAQATRLAVTGAAIGLALSLMLMPVLGTQLYAVQPRDPLTFTGVPLALLAVALLAAAIPARRAMTVEPSTALRAE